MALPVLAALCTDVESSSQGLKIRFPGGAEINVQVPTIGLPEPLETAKMLLAQASAALAPLQPIFNIVGTIVAIVEFAKVVPNPVEMAKKLKQVGEGVSKLLSLVPLLSVPILVLDMIDAILATLSGLLRQLEAMVEQQARIAAAQTRATALGSTQLQAIVDCANQNLTVQMQSMGEGMGPLNQLIALLNSLLSLIPGGIAIPSFASLGTDAAAAIGILNSAVTALQGVRALIPI